MVVAYNGTIPTGGDSLTENLNIYYKVRFYSLTSPPASRSKQLALAFSPPSPRQIYRDKEFDLEFESPTASSCF
jgi:hypothetical protein